jgi:hypothetical protein
MSQKEARQYVDIVVEHLHQWAVISEPSYGRITEGQLETLADKIRERSEQ